MKEKKIICVDLEKNIHFCETIKQKQRTTNLYFITKYPNSLNSLAISSLLKV
jgi:hypothetical protein